jgi:hypothetical protein
MPNGGKPYPPNRRSTPAIWQYLSHYFHISPGPRGYEVIFKFSAFNMFVMSMAEHEFIRYFLPFPWPRSLEKTFRGDAKTPGSDLQCLETIPEIIAQYGLRPRTPCKPAVDTSFINIFISKFSDG